MDSRSLDTLSQIDRALGVVSFEQRFHEDLLAKYIGSDFGLVRTISDPSTSNGSRTGSSFAVFALAEGGLLKAASDWKAWRDVPDYFVTSVLRDIVSLEEAQKRADPKLNEYSIPIWAVGLLKIAGVSAVVRDQLVGSAKFEEVILSISSILKNDGCLRRVSLAANAPSSAYLTFWAVSALTSASEQLNLRPDTQNEINDALIKTAIWAEAALSQLIADHHAGLLARLDIVEAICAACITWRLHSRGRGRPADDLKQLSAYAVTLTLDHYFENGSFKLSRPVYSDHEHKAILCPTSESLLFILSSFSLEALAQIFETPSSHKQNLGNEHDRPSRWLLPMETFRWIQRNRQSAGYPPDAASPFSVSEEITVFSTAATVAFCKLLEALLDKIADKTARAALDVPSVPPRTKYAYPDDLGKVIETRVVGYLRDPVKRRFARHSIILHGPPGTAKTSIAKQIATDLGWPFKLITQSDFLKGGRDKIETEADQIFTACAYLKEVVVLFDELEELILSRDAPVDIEGKGRTSGSDRDSRLLTTSMLPKIHELRDRRRIVFIFATNRLRQIDQAATRLGRFDMIYFVDYPAVALHKAAMSAHLVEMKLMCGKLFEEIKLFIDRLDLESSVRVSGDRILLTYKDVEYILEELIDYYLRNHNTPNWSEPLELVHQLINKRHKANQLTYSQFAKVRPSVENVNSGDRI